MIDTAFLSIDLGIAAKQASKPLPANYMEGAAVLSHWYSTYKDATAWMYRHSSDDEFREYVAQSSLKAEVLGDLADLAYCSQSMYEYEVLPEFVDMAKHQKFFTALNDIISSYVGQPGF